MLRDGAERMAVEQGWALCAALAERIAAHPAQTLDGLRVKARALAVLGEQEDTVRRDLVRVLGGRAPSPFS